MWKVCRRQGSSIEPTFRDWPHMTEVLFLQDY